jgi:hypothetical protein
MENKEKVYAEQIEPLLKQALRIAVSNRIPFVWSTVYGKNEDAFLMETMANFAGERGTDFPRVYDYWLNDLQGRRNGENT